MYPTRTIFFLPLSSRHFCRSVSVNDPGNCLCTTASPSLGFSSANSSASSVPGVKTGAPCGVSCTTWTTGAPAARYFSSSEAMTLREASTLETASLPLAYSFWASMMARTLSLVEAVAGERPSIERKEGADDMFLFFGGVFWWG